MSLRDVDRVLTVMSWFYQQSRGNRTLYNLMDNSLYRENEILSSDDEDEEVFFTAPQVMGYLFSLFSETCMNFVIVSELQVTFLRCSDSIDCFMRCASN